MNVWCLLCSLLFFNWRLRCVWLIAHLMSSLCMANCLFDVFFVFEYLYYILMSSLYDYLYICCLLWWWLFEHLMSSFFVYDNSLIWCILCLWLFVHLMSSLSMNICTFDVPFVYDYLNIWFLLCVWQFVLTFKYVT